MIDIIKYIVLGIIQGITEILPISSSGHLLVFRNLFNTNMFNDLNFEIVIHFGSLIALFFIFKNDIIKLIKGFFSYVFTKDKEIKKKYKLDFRYALLIIVASLPAAIVGVIFKDLLEKALENIKIVGIAFSLTALALFLARNLSGNKEKKDITFSDALLIGLMQAIAIVPGLSRSGIVLIACLFRGFKRETALNFAFLMFFPITLGSFVLGIKDIVEAGNIASIALPYFLGLVFAIISTYIAAKILFKVMKKGKLLYFAIYCVLISLFTLFIL